MKRIISVLLLITTALLCSCARDGDPNGENTAGTTTETITDITVPPEDDPFDRRVTLSENTEYNSLFSDRSSGSVAITGESESVRLILPEKIKLKGDLMLSGMTLSGNCTVYANGHTFTVNPSVSCDSSTRLTVYGGSDEMVVGTADLILLGGKYNNIYGGGHTADLLGNTNIVLGGNANTGDSTDDGSSSLSPCHVVGGGWNGRVTGSTNITIKDNAVARMVCGAGVGQQGATVKEANIFIEGGKVMNVFGGSLQTDVPDLDANITMTGGLVEAIFGGCQSKNMTGSVDIRLLGGEVSRRVYTGCYNDYGSSYKTNCKVTGVTCLTIGPQMKLCTATELSSGNKADMGVYCGSRYGSRQTGEVNVLIFLDGCYSLMNSNIGDSSKGYMNIGTSFHDYVYDVSSGGTVYPTAEGTHLRIAPNKSYTTQFMGKQYNYSENENENLTVISTFSGSGAVRMVSFVAAE